MGAFLHSLVAIAIMSLGLWLGYPLAALVINTLLWPLRELWQKIGRGHPLKDFFTFHVTLEWGAPVLTGLLIHGVAA